MATKKGIRITVEGVDIYIVNINKKQVYYVPRGGTFKTLHEVLFKINPQKEAQRWLKRFYQLQEILGD